MPRRATCTILAVLVFLAPLHASAQQQEGVIVEIGDDGVIVIAIDHYGAGKKGHTFERKRLKIVDNAVFVLDGRIVPRDIALRAGRRFYAQGSSKGCSVVAALSERATDVVGTIAAIDGATLILTIPHGPDAEELAIEVADDARVDGADGDLAVGMRVTVAPARDATVDVLSPATRDGAVAGSVPVAVDGLLTAKGDRPGTFTMTTVADGAWVTFAEERKRPPQTTVQCRFQGRSAAGLDVGARLAYVGYWKRKNKMDRFALVLGADPGRREGVVRKPGGSSLVLTGPDGEEFEVGIEGAEILIDGERAEADAIPAGSHAFAFDARPQTIRVLESPE